VECFTIPLVTLYKVISETIFPVNERGQVPLSDPLSEVLRPKFGLRPELSQNLTWRLRFGLRIFLDRILVLARY